MTPINQTRYSPLRSTFKVIIALISVLTCACSNPTPQEREHENYEQIASTLKDEKEVGRHMAAKLAGAFGVSDQATALKYLNLVGATVASQSTRPEITYHFGILISPEINAFATPGGYIFVTTTLLKTVRTESELAGILGHEIAHVTENHMSEAIMPKREVSASETLTRLLSRGGSDLGYSLGKVVNAGLDLLLETGLGPEKESDADSVGTTFALSAGYSPQALYEFLSFLEKQNGSVTLSKTHPPFPLRLKNLRKFLAKNRVPLNSHSKNPEILATRFLKNLIGLRSSER